MLCYHIRYMNVTSLCLILLEQARHSNNAYVDIAHSKKSQTLDNHFIRLTLNLINANIILCHRFVGLYSLLECHFIFFPSSL